jgi:hypothetical protein
MLSFCRGQNRGGFAENLITKAIKTSHLEWRREQNPSEAALDGESYQKLSKLVFCQIDRY